MVGMIQYVDLEDTFPVVVAKRSLI